MSLIRIRTNKLGLAMFFAGGLTAGIGIFVLRLPDVVVMLGIGLVVIVLDLIVRWRFRAQSGWLTRREFGGVLYVVPMWGIGIVAIVGGVANFLDQF